MRTALVALTLYALLPVLRNTVVGHRGRRPGGARGGRGLGMTDGQLLRRVELPLAASVILAGIRLATVIGIGLATIAAAIGAGGLGVFIFRGVAMVDNRTILAGALPAAALALARRRGCSARSSAACGRRDELLRGLLRAPRRCSPPAAAAGTASSSGSKNFTEQRMLGELLAQTLERAGIPVERQARPRRHVRVRRRPARGPDRRLRRVHRHGAHGVLKEPPDTDPARVLAARARGLRGGRARLDWRRSASTTPSRWSCRPDAGVRTISRGGRPGAQHGRRASATSSSSVPTATPRSSACTAWRSRDVRTMDLGSALPRPRRAAGRRRRRAAPPTG